MYNIITGISDTDDIRYCLRCGAEIGEWFGDGTGKCDKCGFRFGVVESKGNADVAPVIHAYWKRVQAAHNTFRCSKCGHIRELNHFGERMATPKLCEMCGAHMNGKPPESEDINV